MTTLSVIFLILCILLVLIGIRLITGAKADRALSAQQEQIIEQLDAFADIQDLLGQQIEAITSSSQNNLASLRKQTEDRLADARDAIEDARVNLEDKITTQSSATKTAITSWRDRIPKIACAFTDVDPLVTEITNARGSGTLFMIDDEVTLLTNRHVFSEDAKNLRDCTLTFPKTDEKVVFNAESVFLSDSDEIDFAQAVLSEPSEDVTNRIQASKTICQNPGTIGDSILIMGYPSIGSDKDITVTEGIISGFEGDFYITSAKVEKGNSGGAAILVKDNCFLGIPTFTTAGQVESLARILDINAI